MDLDLRRLRDMHPLLAVNTALEYAYRAAIGLGRHGHVPGASWKASLDDDNHEGNLQCSTAEPDEGRQLDYIRVTEDAAEAIILALVSVARGWVVRRRLQRGEFADWLVADKDNNFVALEVSGIDVVDVGKRRLREKVAQVRQSVAAPRKAACVVELGPPRFRLATV
jgi:hypothetical protein